ncbi:MAG: hypothetical protein HQ596_04340 [Candidatus Saganbacteria bacterium]|nr:hypothetical protein [Candidatus Saganbacteria bacterium]
MSCNDKRMVIVFVAVSISVLLLSGCGLISRLTAQKYATDLRAGTGIDLDYNITGEADVFTNEAIVYFGLDFVNARYLEGGVGFHLYIDGDYKGDLAYENQKNISDEIRRYYGRISTTESYLQSGAYFIKVTEWDEESPTFEGGALTFTVTRE